MALGHGEPVSLLCEGLLFQGWWLVLLSGSFKIPAWKLLGVMLGSGRTISRWRSSWRHSVLGLGWIVCGRVRWARGGLPGADVSLGGWF